MTQAAPEDEPAPFEALLGRIRTQLKARGAVGLQGLAKNFRILDRNRSGFLDEEEFMRLIQMCQLQLSDAEVRQLFKSIDENGSGSVDMEEFLRSVRGPLPPVRRDLVVKVFYTLDSLGDGNGSLGVEDVRHAFDARSSPDVIAGRKTEGEVLREFVGGFEGSRGNHDGVVTLAEWLRYYEELSASIDSDDVFGAMVASVWSALKTLDENGKEVPVIRYTPQRAIDNLERILRDKIWQKTCDASAATFNPFPALTTPRTHHDAFLLLVPSGSTRSKNEKKVLEDAFKLFDCDGSLTISLPEFAKAMERFGLYASADEVGALFVRYDTNCDGLISFAEFKSVLEADGGKGVSATGTTLELGTGAVQGIKKQSQSNGGQRAALSAPAPPSQPFAQPMADSLRYPAAPSSRRGSTASQGAAYPPPQRPSTAAGTNVRARSLANPARTTVHSDPDYFKKSSHIFG